MLLISCFLTYQSLYIPSLQWLTKHKLGLKMILFKLLEYFCFENTVSIKNIYVTYYRTKNQTLNYSDDAEISYLKADIINNLVPKR